MGIPVFGRFGRIRGGGGDSNVYKDRVGILMF